MDALEELVFSAFEHGKRDQLFEKVTELKKLPGGDKRPIRELYDEAYTIVMKT